MHAAPETAVLTTDYMDGGARFGDEGGAEMLAKGSQD